MSMAKRDYKAEKHKRRHKFDETKDDLKRGMSVMIEMLRWIMYLNLAGVLLLGAGFIGLVYYLLVIGLIF